MSWSPLLKRREEGFGNHNEDQGIVRDPRSSKRVAGDVLLQRESVRRLLREKRDPEIIHTRTLSVLERYLHFVGGSHLKIWKMWSFYRVICSNLGRIHGQ